MFLTIPQKSVVMDMRGESSVLARLAGELLEGEGLVHSLNGTNISYTGKRVLILGAGGGAAAIAASLVSPALQASRDAAAEIALYDPTPGRAEALAVRLAAAGPASVYAVPGNDLAGFDVVINASSLGLRLSDAMPCDVSRMSPHAALVDILMEKPADARRTSGSRPGLPAHPGFEMMIRQAPLYLEFMGLNDAPLAVRRDSGFIRRQIYPVALLGEIELLNLK